MFWFGPPQTEEAAYASRRKLWFGKSDRLDQIIRDRFLRLYEQAAAGQLDDWQQFPLGCLALLLLLDQFPRNMFRQTPRAFATDQQALTIAKQTVDRQFDRALEPLQRLFVYVPFEHSENLDDQQRAVELLRHLSAAAPELLDCYDYALRHQAVIQRFGRFPHRNGILRRQSTPAEVEFLKQPGSSF